VVAQMLGAEGGT